MTLIHAPTDAAPEWPYDLAQLRQDNPNVSFPVSPTAEDLAPFKVFEVQPTDPPACDPRTQRLEEAQPRQIDGIWQQRWDIRNATPEEIAAYDAANQPLPNWARFKRVALGSSTLKDIAIAAYSTEPIAAGALSTALYQAEVGNVADFADAWKLVCRAANVSPEVIAGFVSVARACHLPENFIDALKLN